MTAAMFQLDAQRHTSRVLTNWLASAPGAFERAGLAAPADHRAGSLRNATGGMVTSSDRDSMLALFQPIGSPSGFAVTDHTAMLVGTVYSCLSKLAGAVLQLPLHEYRYNAAGDRERVLGSPLWWMLNEAPIEGGDWTAASWKEWIVRCVHLRGDQHTQILRGTGRQVGQVAGLLPLHPDNVQARRTDAGLRYDVMDSETGRVYGVAADDMLHFAGFGFDGCRSLSAISHAGRGAISNALAAADFTGRNLGEGAMPQIALTYPNKLSPDQAKLLRDSFVATYNSSPGTRKLPLIMTEGGSATPLSISPVDMDLLASRMFEKQDICEILGVPPILIGNSEKTSSWGTGVEQITLGFVRFTVKPHLCRWEEELNRKLFRRAGRFVEHELDGLLRGDSKAQSDAFRAALGGPGLGDAYMTVNEVRRLKNLPPTGDPADDKLFKAAAKTTTPPAGPAEPKEPTT